MYNVCVVPKLNAPQSKEVLHIIELIKQAASDIGVLVTVAATPGDLSERNPEGWDWLDPVMFLAVGGDGTMLQAMRWAAEQASMSTAVAYGINLGQVGFLTDMAKGSISDAAFRSTLSVLFSGENQYVEERIVLSMSFAETAVNEISIAQKYADVMINYHLWIDNQDAGIHKANSLLISTPTGSTAYSLSAGGVLMTPTLKAIQIVPVAPIRLTSRPIIAPHDQVIRVQVWGENISIRVDGQVKDHREYAYTQEDPYTLDVIGNEYVASVIHFNGWNFFDMLSAKLGWIKK